MNNYLSYPVIAYILKKLDSLSPKAQILGNYIIQKPSEAVFMTTRELAETCNISEATVTRFVSALGYHGYTDFIRALREGQALQKHQEQLEQIYLENNILFNLKF